MGVFKKLVLTLFFSDYTKLETLASNLETLELQTAF